MTEPILEFSGVSKNFGGLRPLRIERLSLALHDHIAILGIDRVMAEVLIGLATGASLPDLGEVRIRGQRTADVNDSSEWLKITERFGIVSERAALLEAMTVAQNLALPFSLEIDPPSESLRNRALALAQEVGLHETDADRRLADLSAAARLRVRLGRALALDPEIVLMEHPSVGIPVEDVTALARDIRSILDSRPVGSLMMTVDVAFASALAVRVLEHDPASGRLSDRRRTGWFGRLLGSQ